MFYNSHRRDEESMALCKQIEDLLNELQVLPKPQTVSEKRQFLAFYVEPT